MISVMMCSLSRQTSEVVFDVCSMRSTCHNILLRPPDHASCVDNDIDATMSLQHLVAAYRASSQHDCDGP